MDILQYLDWGIAAVFALCMFLVCRHLIIQMRQDRVFMEDRLIQTIHDYNQTIRDFTVAKIANTQVLSELTTWLKAKNGQS